MSSLETTERKAINAENISPTRDGAQDSVLTENRTLEDLAAESLVMFSMAPSEGTGAHEADETRQATAFSHLMTASLEQNEHTDQLSPPLHLTGEEGTVTSAENETGLRRLQEMVDDNASNGLNHLEEEVGVDLENLEEVVENSSAEALETLARYRRKRRHRISGSSSSSSSPSCSSTSSSSDSSSSLLSGGELDDVDDMSDDDVPDSSLSSFKSCLSDPDRLQQLYRYHRGREMDPPDTWRPFIEVRQRELGYRSSEARQSHLTFQRRAGSSVDLVRKLEANVEYSYEVHSGCVNALHFNDSGTLLASGSDDLKVVIYDWINSKPFFSYDSGHRSNVFQAKFLPFVGDTHVVTAARDGQVRLKRLSSSGAAQKGSKRLAQHKGAAHKLALLNDSANVFYSCGEDAVTYRIDLREDKPTKCYTCKENSRKIPLYSIHANPMKEYEHVVGGRDQYIRIYDTRYLGLGNDEASLVKKFSPHHLDGTVAKAHLTCAVYNYNGTEILGTYNDEDIYLFDNNHSDGAEHIHRYTGHRNSATVKGVNFYGPRSEFIVSGSDCGNVFLWDKESQEILNYFHSDDGGITNVLEPHPHLPILATSGLDSDVKIWIPHGTKLEKMSKFKQDLKLVTKKNRKERESDRNMPEVIDSQMLWFLMRTLRRATASRAHVGTDAPPRVIASSSSDEDDSSGSRGAGGSGGSPSFPGDSDNTNSSGGRGEGGARNNGDAGLDSDHDADDGTVRCATS